MLTLIRLLLATVALSALPQTTRAADLLLDALDAPLVINGHPLHPAVPDMRPRPLADVEDLIATQARHAELIAPPLTDQELDTVRLALWNYEIVNNKTMPTHFQGLAIAHLSKGLPVRVGDYMVLHGALVANGGTPGNELERRLRECVKGWRSGALERSCLWQGY